MDIIDLEKEDLLRVPGIGSEEAERVLGLIESLTVEEGAAEEAPAQSGGPTEQELAEARELAADILGLKLPESNVSDRAGAQQEPGPSPHERG